MPNNTFGTPQPIPKPPRGGELGNEDFTLVRQVDGHAAYPVESEIPERPWDNVNRHKAD